MNIEATINKLRMTGANIVDTNSFGVIYKKGLNDYNIMVYDNAGNIRVDNTTYNLASLTKHFIIGFDRSNQGIRAVYVKNNLDKIMADNGSIGTLIGKNSLSAILIQLNCLEGKDNKVLLLISWSSILLVDYKGNTFRIPNEWGFLNPQIQHMNNTNRIILKNIDNTDKLGIITFTKDLKDVKFFEDSYEYR